MKQFKTVTNIVAFSMLLMSFNSCTKESEEPSPELPETFKEIKTVLLNSGSTGVINFNYKEGKLTKMTENYVSENRETISIFSYDNKGNLTNVEISETSDNSENSSYTVFYTYYSDERLKTQYTLGSQVIRNYSYDDIRVILNYTQPNNTYHDQYIYIDHGNLKLWEYGGAGYKVEYEFDDKPNAFGSTIEEYVDYIRPNYPTYLHTSANNIISLITYETKDGITSQRYIYGYDYVYDEDGYPVSCIRKSRDSWNSPDWTGSETFDYVYE